MNDIRSLITILENEQPLPNSFWMNSTTYDIIPVDTSIGHSGTVLTQPDLFGVDTKQAENILSDMENDDLYNELFSTIKQNGWVRVIYTKDAYGSIATLDGYNIRNLLCVSRYLNSKNPLILLVLETPKMYHNLDDHEDIEYFLKYGKVK